jgi:hypothetical protein
MKVAKYLGEICWTWLVLGSKGSHMDLELPGLKEENHPTCGPWEIPKVFEGEARTTFEKWFRA